MDTPSSWPRERSSSCRSRPSSSCPRRTSPASGATSSGASGRRSISAPRSPALELAAEARAGGAIHASSRPPLNPSRWLIPLAPADQHLVGGGLEGEAQAEQALEGGGRVVSAVEPEHELVEVGLEVRRP